MDHGILANIAFLVNAEPHINSRNTSEEGKENCTVWYHPCTGTIGSIGADNSQGYPASVRLYVQKSGLLPLFFGRTDALKDNETGLGIVLESIRQYRELKFGKVSL